MIIALPESLLGHRQVRSQLRELGTQCRKPLEAALLRQTNKFSAGGGRQCAWTDRPVGDETPWVGSSSRLFFFHLGSQIRAN